MPTSIADLFVTVSSDVSGALGGLSNVDNALGRTTTTMQAAAPAGLALAGAATAIGVGFLEAVNVASDFEHQINGIKSVMSPVEVLEFGEAVENLAIKLGTDTVFSSSQAAEGIEELIKAGVPLPDILNGAAAAALDLAAATGVPVAQAATFAATAMNTFHLSAAELPAIMDTIANTANATASDVSGLQLAFAQIGPVAAGIGISFNDTAEALGIFANNGLKGSDAGTSLKTMLLNLEPSTKSQTAAFKELGLITADGGNQFFDSEGKAKSLRDIFEILKTSTAGLTAEQKINLLQTAFGTDAVRAATIAAAEGAAGWDEVSASMEKMGGVQVAAAQRNQGLTGSLNQLGGSFEAVQITIGNLFLPALTALAGMATTVLNAFLGLDPTLQVIIVAAVGIAGALAGLTAAFVLLTPVVTALGVAFGVLTAAASPWLAIVAAIAVAVGALYLAWQTDFGGIQEVTAETWAALQPLFANLQQFLSELGDALGPVFANIGETLQPVMAALSEALHGWLEQLPSAVLAAGDFFNAVSAIWTLITTGTVTDNLFGLSADDAVIAFLIDARSKFIAVKDAVGELIGWVQNLWAQFTGGDAGGAVQGALGGILTAVQNVIGGVGNAIGGLVGQIQNPVGVVQSIFSGLAETIQQSCLIAGGLFAGLVDQLGNLGGALGNAWEGVKSTIAGLFAQIPGLLSGQGDPWASFVLGIWNLGPRIAEAFGNLINFIRDTVAGIPGMIAGLGDLFGPIVTAAWNIGQGLGDAVGNFVTFIFDSVSGIGTWISENGGGIFQGIVDAAWNIGQGLGDAVGNFVSFIVNAVAGIGQWIAENSGGIFQGIVDAAWNIGQELGDAVGNFVSFIVNAVAGIGTWVAENAGGIFQPIIDAAWNIGAGLADAVGNFTGFIGQSILNLIGWVIENAPNIFAAVVDAATNLLTRLGEILGPVAQFVGDLFARIPEWFANAFGGGAPAPGGGGGTGGGTLPGATGPVVVIENVYISSESEMQAFFEQMSNYIAESTGRVSATITASLPSGA